MDYKKKNKFREEDFYIPIRNHLTGLGYTVRSEVSHCDVAAVKDDELVIVEMKKSLNLEVIIQAVLRQRMADKVYIAVPKPGRGILTKRWKNICHLLRRLEIGLILVSSVREDSVDVQFEPGVFDRNTSIRLGKRKRGRLVYEFNERHGDYNTGGSTGKKLVTAYREKSIHIACCLEKYGELSPKQLRLLGTDDKKTLDILGDNHYGWFERVSRGIYRLTEKGKQEIYNFSELAGYYRDLIR